MHHSSQHPEDSFEIERSPLDIDAERIVQSAYALGVESQLSHKSTIGGLLYFTLESVAAGPIELGPFTADELAGVHNRLQLLQEIAAASAKLQSVSAAHGELESG